MKIYLQFVIVTKIFICETVNMYIFSKQITVTYSRCIFLAHLSQKLKWAFLNICPLSVGGIICKFFTFSSYPEPQGQILMKLGINHIH